MRSEFFNRSRGAPTRHIDSSATRVSRKSMLLKWLVRTVGGVCRAGERDTSENTTSTGQNCHWCQLSKVKVYSIRPRRRLHARTPGTLQSPLPHVTPRQGSGCVLLSCTLHTSSAPPRRQRPHSFQVRSIAEVAKYLPSSEASAHMTRPSCPSMTLMSEWSRIDHSLTLLS